MLPLKAALGAALLSALAVLVTRAFPFLLFTRRKPPRLLAFIARYLPPMVTAILLVYCLRGTDFRSPPFGIPALLALALTSALHLWKGNAMLSIFAGTGAYMALIRLL